MGNKNCVTKEYMKDNERFADVFNYLIFDGKSVIKPDEAWAINSCADLNLEINEKEGKVNMCKAIEDMKKESEAIGIEIGRREKEKEMCKAIEDMRKESEAIGMEKAIISFAIGSKNKGESRECIISDLISFYDLPEEKAIYYYNSAVDKTA